MRKTDGRGRVPIKLYSWTLNFEFCVTFTCCEIALFCIFFQPRKNFELMGLTKNQRQDSARGPQFADPWLRGFPGREPGARGGEGFPGLRGGRCEWVRPCICPHLRRALFPPAVLQGEYLGQKVAVKNIKCDVTAQAFLDETAVMT